MSSFSKGKDEAMSSSLAYLDNAAKIAVESQLKDPSLFIEKSPLARRRIRGIEVIDSEAVDNRRLLLEAYQEDAASLRHRLDEHGITVLAMLPKAAWSALAKEANLFRFTPKEDGSVPASTALLQDIELRARQQIGWYAWLVLSMAGVLFVGMSFFAAQALGIKSLPGLIGMITAAGIFGAYIGGFLVRGTFLGADGKPAAKTIATIERDMIRKSFDHGADEETMRLLWPAEGVDQRKSVDLKIGMPPAPIEAQENLVRAANAGYELTLYTVAEAVSFLEDPAEVFIKAQSPRWGQLQLDQDQAAESKRIARLVRAEKRRLAIARALDPIVTIDHESVTAIVVQYGDFPIEHQLIDRVLASEHLL